MKRFFYLFEWVVVGLILSFIAHALIETGYINYALGRGMVLENHPFLGLAYCALPYWVQYSLLALGVIGGYEAGKFFWRKIYIKKRSRFYKF